MSDYSTHDLAISQADYTERLMEEATVTTPQQILDEEREPTLAEVNARARRYNESIADFPEVKR